MRALQVTELGTPPELAEIEPPAPGEGEALLDVAAVALNPVDIAVASGRFYAGSPPLPYIPGCEVVGRVLDGGSRPAGTRVWTQGGGIGISRNGSLAQRVAVPAQSLVDVPDGVSDELACALGVAGVAGWAPLSWRLPIRAGDRVLVLGATSTAGLVAIQAAAILGASKIVGAGRRPARLKLAGELGASASVGLDDHEDLATAFVEAFGGERPTYVFDALWGPPLVAALEAAAPGVRVVHIGQSAAPEATIPSSFVRGRQAEIVGYSNFAVPVDVLAGEYRKLVEHAAAGRVRLDVETYPLDRAPEAWGREAAGPGAKLVVIV